MKFSKIKLDYEASHNYLSESFSTAKQIFKTTQFFNKLNEKQKSSKMGNG